MRSQEGWELVAFRDATALGDGVWRLGGLLRGLQGTEGEMRAGAEAGAIVIVLDDALVRLDMGRDERGLPLLFRAGLAGAPPGGAGASEQIAACTGVHDRPWSPAHLKAWPEGAGLRLGWRPRRRLHGDGWDADRGLDPGLRFRVRFRDGEVLRRTVEVEGTGLLYADAERDIDFPAGLASASVEVSQWGEAWGCGSAARLSLAT